MGLPTRIIFSCCLGLCTFSPAAQSAHREWREADKLFDKEQYILAEKKYSSALEKKPDAALHYNWANSLYEQEAYLEAIEQYQKSLSMPEADKELRFKAHHNKGNAHARTEEWEKAIADYQEALKLNPDHDPTRENLWRAMQQLPPPQEQPQQGKDGDENKENQEQKEGESPTDEKEDAREEDATENPTSAKDRPLTKEELERLMKAVEREDARVQESRKRDGQGNTSRPLKDW